MNINILSYSLFGIAGGQEVDHTFAKFILEIVRFKAKKYHFIAATRYNIKLAGVKMMTYKV